MNKKICRLCLQTISGNYETIGQSLKNILKLNMDISKEAVKCVECSNNLEVFLKFKTACDYMWERTKTTDLKDDINLDPEKIEITSNLISPMESRNEIRCSFCTKTSGRGLTSLSESKEHKFLVNVLKEHIPKLNLNITEELLTCETCLEGLQSVSSFVMTCLDMEQKISKYTGIKGTDDKGQVELEDVQQFIANLTIKFDDNSKDVNELKESDQIQEGYTVQTKAEIKYEMEIENPELFIKTEDIDIKTEQSNCDSFQEPPAIIKIDNDSFDKTVFKSQGRNKKYVDWLELTYKNSEGITMYKCETCSYETKRKNHLRRHKSTHKSMSELRRFKCELCSYETNYNYHLKGHKLVHKSSSDTTMFKCNLCPYETKRRSHLKRHRLTHKSTSELTMFKCKLCSYEAKRQDHLRHHKLTHKSTSKLRMFKCELCSYETKRRYYLTQHILIHKKPSELTIFKCELCSYEAKRRYYLTQHKRIHKSSSDITIFKCELCPYEAKHREYLRRHKLTHKNTSELTMFKCEFCSYEAKRRDVLRRHQLIHKSTSELRPFKCELCSYEAKRQDYLKRHKLTHKITS